MNLATVGVGMLVSSKHSAAPAFFFYSLPRPLVAPWRPPAQPQPCEHAPGPGPAPPSRLHGGDGWRRRPKVKGGEVSCQEPFCAHWVAPPPPVAPSLPVGCAPRRMTFPGLGNCFSGPLEAASGPFPETAAHEGKASSCGCHLSWIPGAPGDPLSARLHCWERVARSSAHFSGTNPGEARKEGASENFLV